jgi:hypothetical protein
MGNKISQMRNNLRPTLSINSSSTLLTNENSISKKHNKRNNKMTSKENHYIMKITSIHLDRFQQQHNVSRTLWEGNYSSPITCVLENGNANVLDVGWVIFKNIFVFFFFVDNK